jgi:flavin-dependent dehydrogenase
MPNPPLPSSSDVRVVGAGPAGSASAQLLSRSGGQVLLL